MTSYPAVGVATCDAAYQPLVTFSTEDVMPGEAEPVSANAAAGVVADLAQSARLLAVPGAQLQDPTDPHLDRTPFHTTAPRGTHTPSNPPQEATEPMSSPATLSAVPSTTNFVKRLLARYRDAPPAQRVRLGGLTVAVATALLLAATGCANTNQGLTYGALPAGGGATPRDSGGSNDGVYGITRADGSTQGAHLNSEPPIQPTGQAITPEHVAGAGASRTSTSSDARYIVQAGDTLYGIARTAYGDASRFRDIVAANGLDPDGTLLVGQELILPDANGGEAGSRPGVTARANTVGNSSMTAASGAAGDPIANAARLESQGSLREARRVLSAALYTLGAADVPTAVNSLNSLNERLLFTTGASGDCTLHTVVRGDTLFSIASAHRVTWQSIRKFNRLVDERIFVGQQLKVLTGTPRVVLLRDQGLVDLWIDDHFVKRYSVSVSNPRAISLGDHPIERKSDAPSDATAGSRVLVAAGNLRLHGTSSAGATASGVAFTNRDIEELYDVVLPRVVVEVR